MSEIRRIGLDGASHPMIQAPAKLGWIKERSLTDILRPVSVEVAQRIEGTLKQSQENPST